MKIVLKDRVVIQRYDAAFILNGPVHPPKSVLKELSAQSKACVTIDTQSGCEFAYVFTKPKSVAWLNAQNWLIDYHDFDRKTPDELEAYKGTYWTCFASTLYCKLKAEEELTEGSPKSEQYYEMALLYRCCLHHYRSIDLMHEYKLGSLKFPALEKLSHYF